MITLHALKYSRASRVLWLLADLGQQCHRVDYPRNDSFHAPDALKQVHPLGKSPVIEDEGATIAESATILRYIASKYADTSHMPPQGTPDYWQHEALLDYVEASFAEGAMPAILAAFDGKPVPKGAGDTLNQHLDYLTGIFGDGPLMFGAQPMLADIQLSYLIALLAEFDLLSNHPELATYWDTLTQQSGYVAALDAVGPMAPPTK